MVRVVGKDGALGAGGGEGGSSGMDGSRKIMRRYQVRTSFYYSGRFGCWVGRLSTREREKKGGGGNGFQEV